MTQGAIKRHRNDDGIDWWMVLARAVVGAVIGAGIGAAIYVFWVQNAWAFLASPICAVIVATMGHSAYQVFRRLGELLAWW